MHCGLYPLQAKKVIQDGSMTSPSISRTQPPSCGTVWHAEEQRNPSPQHQCLPAAQTATRSRSSADTVERAIAPEVGCRDGELVPEDSGARRRPLEEALALPVAAS